MTDVSRAIDAGVVILGGWDVDERLDVFLQLPILQSFAKPRI